MNWSPGETGRKPLVKIKHVSLNSPATEGYQVKLNYKHNNKVMVISEIFFPKEGCT